MAVAAAACRKAPPPTPQLVERAGAAMGSELRLTAWTADEAAARSAFDAVVRGVRSARRADERLARRQRRAAHERRGRRSCRSRSARTSARRCARRVRSASGPAASSTSRSARSRTSGSSTTTRTTRFRTPTPIRRRLPLIDYRADRDRRARRHGVLKRKGMRVHLGGIGKGYAVDRAVSDHARARVCATS